MALSRSSRVTMPTRSRRLPDLDAALAMTLAEHHRVRDRVVRGDEARWARHDLSGGEAATHCAGKGFQHSTAGVVERAAVDGRGRLRVASASQRCRDRRRIELGRLACGRRRRPGLPSRRGRRARGSPSGRRSCGRDSRRRRRTPASGRRSRGSRSPPRCASPAAASSASRSPRSPSLSGAWRYCAIMSWLAPCRRHHASASASRSETPA